MLCVNFQSLVDFVEIEKASMQMVTMPGRKRPGWFRLTFGSENFALEVIKYLEWESTLDDPTKPDFIHINDTQSKSAREILSLYAWWTEIRPARVEDSIWPEWDSEISLFSDKVDKSTVEYKEYRAMSDNAMKQEELWEEEDTAMLVRLVKLRRSLWS